MHSLAEGYENRVKGMKVVFYKSTIDTILTYLH